MTTSTEAEPAGREAVVAANVRRLREAAGISQVELATLIAKSGYDLGEMAVCNIENGKRRIRINDLFPLGEALGVDPMSLLRPGAGSGQLCVITLEGGAVEEVTADEYEIGEQWTRFLLQGQLVYFGRVLSVRIKQVGAES